MGAYLAHSKNKQGVTDPLCDHLENVARMAAEFARDFGASEEARVAGLLHDLGKYGDLFQRRLAGLETGIDHWSPGATALVKTYGRAGLAAAFAAQGHHTGLQSISSAATKSLDPETLQARHPLGLRLSSPDIVELLARLEQDGLSLPGTTEVKSRYPSFYRERKAAAMLYERMLFSALVDADFLDTEAHFQGIEGSVRHYREEGPALDAREALSWLLEHIETIAAKPEASADVVRMRKELLGACLEAGERPRGAFTLTAPTGAGKTLSMLAFALKHAAEHNLRRVIMVIPYLSIIEQTAKVYRAVFAPHMPEHELGRYVLEHHSLAGMRGKDKANGESGERLLAENWDSPIVVTTSVQFLESLFASRSSACRKLHNIAESVVLFDEVQTLPESLVVPTLATLSALSAGFGTSVVFSTATQPAFEHLNDAVKGLLGERWEPVEIVPRDLKLFDRARRTRVSWPEDPHKGVSWESIADRICAADRPQSLCIVNLKRHALGLFRLLAERSAEGAYHLSTSMCPAHRLQVLEEVRRRLKSKLPCRLVSTQCVEAGVDIDFPAVFRALGPMDSIAQAAGRCNRNGTLDLGDVYVFVPEKEEYPGGGYQRAAGVTRIMLLSRMEGLDIDDPETFGEYYRRLYGLSHPDEQRPDLVEAIRRQDFAETAELYRVIPHSTINVLVPFDPASFSTLAEKARAGGLSADWIKRARPHTVGIYRPRRDAAIFDRLEAVALRDGTPAEDWFIYLRQEHYDASVGLAPPDSMDVNIA